MKKLLLYSLSAMFMFTSCEQPTVSKSDLPIKVVKNDTTLEVNIENEELPGMPYTPTPIMP